MGTHIIQALTTNFEAFANVTNEGVEFWLARDLQKLLDYTQWRNFVTVIEKAKTSCKLSNQEVLDHFADVSKTIDMPQISIIEMYDISNKSTRIYKFTIFHPQKIKWMSVNQNIVKYKINN